MKTSTGKNRLDQIGKWRYPQNKFIYEKEVLLKQTNLFGNTYFSNFIEWQGEAREKFYLTHPAALEFLEQNPSILMVTHTLQHRFISNVFFGQLIRIELTTKDILDYSLKIIFRYFYAHNNLLVGEGWQKICFMDRLQNTPCRVPQIFLDLAIPLQED